MEIVIRPKRTISIDLREIWDYRELFYTFVWRNIKVRYKQSILGIGWVLFQPTVTTGIFSIFFGKLAKIPSEHLPYTLFVYIGLLYWTFFSAAVSTSSSSVIGMGSIIKKVYFPRIIIPLSSILTAGVDFLVSFIPLVILLIYYQVLPNVWLVPYILLSFVIIFLSSSGIGMLLSSLNVRYRDVNFIIPFFIQTGLFLTPVIYPIGVIFDYRKWILMLNPLSGVIENFRALVKGGADFDLNLLLISILVSILFFVIGLYVFKKTEQDFADVV